MSRAEVRIVNSNLLGDVATKLGFSARGADARFDSDSNASVFSSGSRTSMPPAPTRRTKRLFSYSDEDTTMSGKSKQSFDSILDDSVDETMNLNGEFSRSFSSINDSSRENVSSSNSNSIEKRKRHQRDVQNELMNENLKQHQSNLVKQNEAAALQNKFWKLQAEKATISNEHEKLKMEMTKITMEKAKIEMEQFEKLTKIEIDKQAKLAKIEIDKQNAIAKMELDAKRKQLRV